MLDNGAILTFCDATFEEQLHYDSGLKAVTFDLHAGRFMLVGIDEGRPNLPLADGAQGLAAPDRGAVMFMGEDWTSLRADRSAALRGKIGRVFDSWGWISNLDVSENVLLSQLQHSRLPYYEILERAEKLAQQFGLSELPKERCPWVRAGELRRAEWVRAFLGDPALLILERPTRDVLPEHVVFLARAVQEALDRGAAVLCTAGSEFHWPAEESAPHERYAMHGSELVPISEGVS